MCCCLHSESLSWYIAKKKRRLIWAVIQVGLNKVDYGAQLSSETLNGYGRSRNLFYDIMWETI